MSLRYTILLITTFTSLLLLLGLHTLAQEIVMNGFVQIEQQQVKQNIHRASAALALEHVQFKNPMRDWASWNETYAFAQGKNPTFVQENLADTTTFTNLHLNLIVFTDKANKILFKGAFDLDKNKEIPFPKSLLTQIQKGLGVLTETQPIQTGILVLPEGILLVGVAPILTNEGQGPKAGAMIVGRFLDPSMLLSLSARTELSLSLFRLTDSHLPADLQTACSTLTSTSPLFLLPLNEQKIAGYTLLTDLYDQPALILKVDLPRTIFQQGKQTLFYTFWAFLVITLALCLVNLWLLDWLILTNLVALSQQVSKIGQKGDFTTRLPVSQILFVPQNELTNLRQDINEMLAALEQSSASLVQLETLLQTLLANAPMVIYAKDLEGCYILANRHCEKILNLPPGGLLGKTDYDIFPRALADSIHETDQQMLLANKVLEVEDAITVKGEERIYLNTKFPLLNATGQPYAVAAFAIDVTVVKKAAKEQADFQQRVIEAQKATLQELAAPLLPLMDKVLAMPLLGDFDAQRAQAILATLLPGGVQHRAKVVILDVTGVRQIEPQVAQTLLQITQAVRLLGSQVVLTGISPTLAQILVQLGADLSGIVTQNTLQSGVEAVMKRTKK